MVKCCSRLVLAAVVALGLTGCGGDNKTAEPKAPEGAPKLEPKTPGTGGPGKKVAGPTGGVQ